MRVTIVPEDRYIAVDGRGLSFDFSADPNIHAMQWFDDHGTVEQKTGGSRPATLSDVQPFVDAWEAERDRIDNPPPPPVPTLAERKATMRAAVKRERDRLETCGFRHGGVVFDSDQRSVQRINTAVQAASVAGPSFSLVWTAADNSDVTLDQAAMLTMPASLAQRAGALHAHAKTLKAAIGSAGNAAALDAIDITAGWPSL